MSYSLDLSTGLVSGSLSSVLSNLTKQTEEMQVQCCQDGLVSLPSQPCGNGTSCENICGINKAGRKYPSKPFIYNSIQARWPLSTLNLYQKVKSVPLPTSETPSPSPSTACGTARGKWGQPRISQDTASAVCILESGEMSRELGCVTVNAVKSITSASSMILLYWRWNYTTTSVTT